MKKYFFDLCVIGGAGHVGLPIGVSFANNGIKTVLLDKNKEALDIIQSGKFPFKERGGDEELQVSLQANMLSTTTSPEAISQSKFIIIIIGTPIDEYLSPRSGDILHVIDRYIDYFQDGHIIILRSTVYPGTTEKIQHYFNKKNKNIHLSFCPERVTQGYAIKEIKKLPQIVSAFNDKTLKVVSDLFQKTTSSTIITCPPIEAELSKLFTNSWRYIKFAVANAFFMIAQDHNLDCNRIFKTMRQDYPRNQDLPSPGFAAGPCLLKDTMQLVAFTNNNFFLGHAAMMVNEGIVNHIITKLKRDLPGGLREKTLGILGMAFKPDSDDHRDSLSYKLRKIAYVECENVLCTDVYVENPEFVSIEQVLQESNVVVLATPHAEYKSLNPSNYPHVKFVDVWNFWPK